MAKKTTRRTTARKATTRKTTKRTAKRASTTASRTRKSTTSRATKAAAPARMKLTTASKPRTKAEVMGLLAEHAGISKKEVAAVFDGMSQIIKKDLSRSGPGAVNLGGLMKVTVQRKPATKARKGINPFTGEPTIFKAKPARNVVKVRPMKALKDLV